jgi:hypothetical protein
MTERRDTRVVAGVGVILNNEGKRDPCMTRNLSRGGMFALTKTKLTDGQMLEVEIVHRGKKLSAAARVTGITPDGCGLSFVEPGADFRAGIDALIGSLITENSTGASRTPHDHVEVKLQWAHLPDGKSWNWWKKKPFVTEVLSLTLDGAALGCKVRPNVGDTVLIFLGDGVTEHNTCRAEVVRHTDSGFAVKFLTPGMEFRRLVSRLRRGEETV